MTPLVKRLNEAQDFFVKEGLGFDARCIAIEEAIAVLEGRARIDEAGLVTRDGWIREATCFSCGAKTITSYSYGS